MCLSTNLFFEARGENPLAQQWVLHSIYNRVLNEEFPSSFCEVMRQRLAYSWTITENIPKSNSLLGYYVYKKYSRNPYELKSWNEAFKTSLTFYLNRHRLSDITEGSICYMTFNRYLQLDFQTNCPSTKYNMLVGNHVFFN